MIFELIKKQGHGAAFDIGSFLANILLVYPLGKLVKLTQGDDPFFAGLLLAAAGLHAAGAYLKRRPMHARLAAQKFPEMGGFGYLLFMTLAIMHYAVFTMCIMVGIEGLGLKDRLGPAEQFVALGGALIPTVLAIAALIPPRVQEQSTAQLVKREKTGDLLIYCSTVVILAWWDGFWVEYLASAVRPSVLLSLVLLVLSTVPFAIFYLAPRMVLLREDYMKGQTWINAFIVMLPLAVRLFFRS